MNSVAPLFKNKILLHPLTGAKWCVEEAGAREVVCMDEYMPTSLHKRGREGGWKWPGRDKCMLLSQHRVDCGEWEVGGGASAQG